MNDEMQDAMARGDLETVKRLLAQEEVNEKLVAEIPKNKKETLRVTWSDYQGKRYLSARVWVNPKSDGEESKPTRKGLTLRPEVWQELLKVLQDEVGMAQEDPPPPAAEE